jgi:O-methyltransferase involved in polyketide biosynthesis
MAERVARRLAAPLASAMGRRTALMAHYFAERARLFDRQITAFLEHSPDATVVALGEGLETQFWRVDNGRLTWLTVDLPDMVALRRSVLPHGERQRTVAASALDPRWTDEVEPGRPVLIVAQGLLPYLRPREVTGLIDTLAQRFPGGSLIFDTPPRWFTGLARLGLLRCGGFRLPPMYFGMSPAGLNRLRPVRPRLSGLRYLPMERWPGGFGPAMRHGHRIPLARRLIPATVWADFAAPRAWPLP